jgi:hypothetical protein
LGGNFLRFIVAMPARLKPMIVRAHRVMRQSKKSLDDWQRVADEQTAKEFELYTARRKRNPRSRR